MQNASDQPNLSAAEKTAMLRVLDGEGPGTVTEMLHFLHLHMPQRMLIPALEMLIKDRLTGKKLAQILEHDFRYDFLNFQKWATARLVKEKFSETRLVAGKNFRTV